MTKILVAYHSGEGQAKKIAERVATVLDGLDFDVEVHDATDAPRPDGFDAVVVGDSIRLERHSRALTRWLRHHRDALASVPLALYQVSMTSARKDAEHDAKADALVQKLLRRTGVHPDRIALFAGALRYSQYGWVTTRIMRAIARREGNDADTGADHEYTDWQAVDRFADDVAALVAAQVKTR